MVSVVIPAYNAEAFILQTVESVLSQRHDPLEVIVVDDGSTDGTRRLLETIDDSRLQVLSGPNGGVSRARNSGLQAGRGELIAFLDADDYWFSHKLEVQVSRLVEAPQLLAVGSLMRYESLGGRVLGVTGVVIDDDDLGLIATGHLLPFPLSSALFRGHVIREVGGFNERMPKTVQVEDLELMAKVARIGPMACIGEVLGAYRIHPHSASARRFAQQRMGVRYVRAKLAAQAGGEDLDWDSFATEYRPTWAQRHGDRVQAWYRMSGLRAAEGAWLRAVGWGMLALVLGPGYTLSRLYRQQRKRA
jgi:glycosyltransferase involved in cell wall biosynthesis